MRGLFRLLNVPADGHAVINARVAQLVEQRIENPRVGGSNPPPGTIFYSSEIFGSLQAFLPLDACHSLVVVIIGVGFVLY